MENDAMKYKIIGLAPDVNLFKEYPDLNKIKGLKTKSADNQKVLRYGFLLYDPKSKLLTDISHLTDRKEKALSMAGYKKGDDGWEREADEILKNLNEDVREVLFVVISQVFHDRKFREYHLKMQELSEFTKLRWEPVKGEDKLKDAVLKKSLREQCNDLHEEIDVYEGILWGDDKDIKKYAEKIMLTNPEQVAAAYTKTYNAEKEEDGQPD